jgi:hypothetical protein
MSTRKRTTYVREGRYVAEVNVEFLENETGWSPYLTIEDACRLDDVRDALRRGDISTASNLARRDKGIGESIRPRSLKGPPARHNLVLESVWNHALCLMFISLPCAPPGGARSEPG